MLARYLFQADERGLLGTLYATTSVTRREVVIGRYLTVVAYAILATRIGVLTSLVDDAIRLNPSNAASCDVVTPST